MQRFERTWLQVLLSALLAHAGGCTLVGLGVGSTVDRYRPVPHGQAPETECEQERAVLKPTARSHQSATPTAGHAGTSRPAAPEERYALVVSRASDGLVVQSHGAERRVLWTDVEHTQCKVGTYALVGLGVGAAIDAATFTTIVVVAISRTSLDFPRQ